MTDPEAKLLYEKTFNRCLFQKKIWFILSTMIEFIQILFSLLIFAFQINNENSSIYGLITKGFRNFNEKNHNELNNYNILDLLKHVSFSFQFKSLIEANTVLIGSRETEHLKYSYSNLVFFAITSFFYINSFLLFICTRLKNSHNKIGKGLFKYFNSNKNNDLENINENYNSYKIHGTMCNWVCENLELSLANFFELAFGIFSLIFMDVLLNKLMISCYFLNYIQFSFEDLLIFIIALITFSYYLYYNIWFIQSVYFYMNFREETKCKFDSLLSKNYNYTLLIIKIFLSLENNFNLIFISNSNAYVFLRVFPIFLCLFLILFCFYQIFSGSEILFLINAELNFLRIFNVFYLATVLVFELVLKTDFILGANAIALIIFSLILSLWLTKILLKLNLRKIIKSENTIIQFAFILNTKLEHFSIACSSNKNENSNNFNKLQARKLKEITNIFLYHKNNCKKNNNCKLSKLNEYSNIDRIIFVFQKEISLMNPSDLKSLSQKDLFLKLFSEAVFFGLYEKNKNNLLKKFFFLTLKLKREVKSLTELQLIKFNYAVSELKSNPSCKKIEADSRVSFPVYLGDPKQKEKDNFLNYALVRNSIKIFEIFNKILDAIWIATESIHAQNYEMLFTNLKKFEILEKKLNKKIKVLIKNKNEYFDFYSFYFIKFIYQKALNKRIENEREIIFPNEVNEIIESHYNSKHFFVCRFEHKKLKIVQSSRIFSHALDKNLSILFPLFCKDAFEKQFSLMLEKSVGLDFQTQLVLNVLDNINNKNKKFNRINGYNNEIENFMFEGEEDKMSSYFKINKMGFDGFDNRIAKEETELGIKLFSLEGKIFSSFRLNDILLYINCVPVKSEIIVFKENLTINKQEKKCNNLIHFSEEIGNLLCIPFEYLNKLKENEFSFDKIFTKYENQESFDTGIFKVLELNLLYNYNDEENLNSVSKEIFFIDYSKYQKHLWDFIRKLLDKELIEECEVEEIQTNFNKRKNELIYFSVEWFNLGYHEETRDECKINPQEIQMVTEFAIIILYKIQIKNDKKQKLLINKNINSGDVRHANPFKNLNLLHDRNNNFAFENNIELNPYFTSDNKNNNNDNDDVDNYNNYLQKHPSLNENRKNEHLNSSLIDNLFEDKSLNSIYNNTDFGSSNYHTKSKVYKIKQNNLINKSQLLVQKRKQSFKRIKFLFASIYFLFFVIFIYGIIMLFMCIKNMQKIRQIFQLNRKFNSLAASYYELMMLLHRNILVYSPNSTAKDFYFNKNYYKKFHKKNVTLNIPEYMILESSIRIKDLRLLLNEIKLDISFITDESIIEEFSGVKKFENYFLRNSNREFSVGTKSVTFFDAFKILLATTEILDTNPDYLTFIYFIDYSQGELDFKNFFLKELDFYQINAINLIINFESMVNMIEYFKGNLNLSFKNYFYSVGGLMVFSLGFFILTHYLILVLIYFIVQTFQQNILANILFLNSMLVMNSFKYHKEKTSILKRLSALYSEDPRDLVVRLKFAKRKVVERERDREKENKRNSIVFSCFMKSPRKSLMVLNSLQLKVKNDTNKKIENNLINFTDRDNKNRLSIFSFEKLNSKEAKDDIIYNEIKTETTNMENNKELSFNILTTLKNKDQNRLSLFSVLKGRKNFSTKQISHQQQSKISNSRVITKEKKIINNNDNTHQILNYPIQEKSTGNALQSTLNKNCKNFNKNILQNLILLILSRTSFFRKFKKFTLFSGLVITFYFTMFFSFFLLTQSEITTQNSLSFSVWNNHQKLLKNGITFNIMLLLNKTNSNIVALEPENELNKQSIEFDYFEKINEFYLEIYEMLKVAKNNPNSGKILKFFNEHINCELIYSEFYSDIIIKNINNEFYIKQRNYTKNYLNDNLKRICKTFHQTEINDIVVLFHSVNELNHRAYYQFDFMEKTYNNLANVYYSDDLFDLFIFILFILRPVYTFIQTNLIDEIISYAFNSFISFMILNLICNFVVDFFFLVVIRKKKIKKIMKMHENINNFIRCLKI